MMILTPLIDAPPQNAMYIQYFLILMQNSLKTLMRQKRHSKTPVNTAHPESIRAISTTGIRNPYRFSTSLKCQIALLTFPNTFLFGP